MEDSGYHFRTGAYVGLTLSLGALCASLVLFISYLTGSRGSAGLRIGPFTIISFAGLVCSIAAALCICSMIYLKSTRKNILHGATFAATLSCVFAALILFTIIKARVESGTDVAKIAKIPAAAMLSGVLSFLLAVSTTLQNRKIEDRQTGCMIIIFGFVIGGIVIRIIVRMLGQ